MSALRITYLTTDSLQEGVGASQVLSYVEGLARRDVQVELHTFEKTTPAAGLADRLATAGIDWRPHEFGRPGAAGGAGRVLRGLGAVRGADLVHARSDLPAASALLARAPHWVWDVRSLWADQRISLGQLRAGSPEERVLRKVERAAAGRSTAVITLTQAVLPVLSARHGDGVVAKATVIPTCVDLDRFPLHALPGTPPVRLLLAGTLNTYYDVPAMLGLFAAGQRRGRAQLDVVAPGPTGWDAAFASVGARRGSASPAEMPDLLRNSHAGLSVCRSDAGISLTAAMPTKVAEFLATGRPVVVNPGLGDADRLVEQARAGVVLRDLTERGFDTAWGALEDLLADPATPARCRALAEEHFDLDRAVDDLVMLYERIVQSR